METLINPIEILIGIDNRLGKIEEDIKKMNELLLNQTVKKILTIKETCGFLNVSLRTLQRYRDEGMIDFIQIGGKIMFRPEDLEKFLQKFKIKGR
jgi:excisionase family DNA binding protein